MDRFYTMDDRGATALEYAIMASLIAVVIIVAVAFLGGNLGDLFNDSANQVANL